MIISVISDIVSQMNSGGNSFDFTYGLSGYYNLEADEKTFPVVIFDADSPFTLQPQQSGYIGEVYKPTLFFMFKSELDWTPVQHDTNAITPAIAAAREFITRCQNADSVIDRITTAGDAMPHINMLDVNASGIMQQFEIKLSINASVCVS